MTDQDVKMAFEEVYNGFWMRYRDYQPAEPSPEWERMHIEAAVLKRKYPLLDEVVNRMMTEIIERAKGRGNQPNNIHKPPE